ncbi:amyloid protein-binding protein 2 [Musca vetustissima]|uniref:amyloid protein-binding protein 2 n=1 Tax=Musca vetustissima TaxID=27455 RepID=UPI002AB77086|nr:amyloid protein-binding protein 2 [Musca vetustissima]
MENVGTKRETLYDRCLCCFVSKLSYRSQSVAAVQQLRYLPPSVLIDIYVLMSQREDLKHMLFEQMADLQIFERLLRFDPARQKLFLCLATLISRGKQLAKELEQTFIQRYAAPSTSSSTRTHVQQQTTKTASKLAKLAKAKLTVSTSTPSTSSTLLSPPHTDDDSVDEEAIIEAADSLALSSDDNEYNFGLDVIDFGLRLGSFLSEAGWLSESIAILQVVANRLRKMEPTKKIKIIYLDCLQRLLHSESCSSNFKSAERTFDIMMELLKEIDQDEIPKPLLANTHTQISEMYFARNEYDDSHMWSVVAMRNLEETTPERIAIDVLRQAAKACVVKRDYQRANILICQAKSRAKKTFGANHQKYADTLLDYGFFLLNVDSPYQSVNVYKEALDIKRCVFGNRNFHVAMAHEDLSYAYYVHEYSTGNFTCARDHIEKSVDILKHLVPQNHLKLASAKRVKALLLEEIALDKMAEGVDDEGLLKQSEELHKFALQLSLEVFGEENVQTAKLYGNLGRLYQTMNRFEEAERMHQKAIKIKTDLLGPYDYEVGLSIGHLASLYNYQMKKYREAEELYLRSIEISLRLFGRSYSGLEYDYLGLCHVYETLREYEKYLQYAHILENWQILRGQNLTMNKTIYPAINEDCSLEEIKQQFFNMCNHNLTPCN